VREREESQRRMQGVCFLGGAHFLSSDYLVDYISNLTLLIFVSVCVFLCNESLKGGKIVDLI